MNLPSPSAGLHLRTQKVGLQRIVWLLLLVSSYRTVWGPNPLAAVGQSARDMKLLHSIATTTLFPGAQLYMLSVGVAVITLVYYRNGHTHARPSLVLFDVSSTMPYGASKHWTAATQHHVDQRRAPAGIAISAFLEAISCSISHLKAHPHQQHDSSTFSALAYASFHAVAHSRCFPLHIIASG